MTSALLHILKCLSSRDCGYVPLNAILNSPDHGTLLAPLNAKCLLLTNVSDLRRATRAVLVALIVDGERTELVVNNFLCRLIRYTMVVYVVIIVVHIDVTCVCAAGAALAYVAALDAVVLSVVDVVHRDVIITIIVNVCM